jgi:TonB-dependent SusC/RagA subfamily outer membrane receptor
MKTKAFLLVLLSIMIFTVASGQKSNKKISVTGSVIDNMQKPLVGAMIFVDGNNTNVTTNNSGLFKLKVRPDADSITVVTFSNGMVTLPLKGKTRVDFVLNGSGLSTQVMPDKKADEKDVNIGYGNVKERDLITPVSTVDGRNNKYANYKDIYQILKTLPGVIVRGTSIQIQGQSSIMSGTQPIFVVDGMVVESVDGISPYQIRNISLLKGSSASIYGSRGANGVILINLIDGTEKSK